ncbi:tryptophan-rich sensory protein [Gillisia sp. M10.2A]|uniref:Tryptophan-rich sensory protein n=1 Tax=Gillisia lutea TaxID=2909668 RepID=A0ABS9EBS3_9FLAO|nr:tryptophan-rich sensory protein [Gillisia lutea]MCF4100339.1 tryptophan-rich sensory protein [Gillisia lutea]
MKRNLALVNMFSVLLIIIVSYYAQIIGINDNTIGGLSKEYRNLFTPASYAFAIWGIIYLALIIYVVFQIDRAFFKDNTVDTSFILQTGPWFFLTNIANAAWVVAWLYEYTLLSVVLMFFMLVCLIKIILNTNMERWDASFKIIAFTWWPICIYAGWISVATVTNVAAYLVKIGWKGDFLSEETWTVLMIVVVVIINSLIIYKRNMREFAAVAVWGLFAIYIRHMNNSPAISYVALGGAGLIFSYIAYHGFVNRKSNPLYKFLYTGEA